MENLTKNKNYLNILKEAFLTLFGDITADMLLIVGLICLLCGVQGISYINIADNLPSTMDLYYLITGFFGLTFGFIGFTGWLIITKINTKSNI
jgi:hypothetical protein